MLPKSTFLLISRVNLKFWKYFKILWSNANLHNMKVVGHEKLNNFYFGHFFIWALDQWQILVYSGAPILFYFYKLVPRTRLQPPALLELCCATAVAFLACRSPAPQFDVPLDLPELSRPHSTPPLAPSPLATTRHRAAATVFLQKSEKCETNFVFFLVFSSTLWCYEFELILYVFKYKNRICL